MYIITISKKATIARLLLPAIGCLNNKSAFLFQTSVKIAYSAKKSPARPRTCQAEEKNTAYL